MKKYFIYPLVLHNILCYTIYMNNKQGTEDKMEKMVEFTEKSMKSGMLTDHLQKAGINKFQLLADEDLVELHHHQLGWCSLVEEVIIDEVEPRQGDIPLTEREIAIAKEIEVFKETGHAYFSGRSRLEGSESRSGFWTLEIWR